MRTPSVVLFFSMRRRMTEHFLPASCESSEISAVAVRNEGVVLNNTNGKNCRNIVGKGVVERVKVDNAGDLRTSDGCPRVQ